jgi:hypothetical protein
LLFQDDSYLTAPFTQESWEEHIARALVAINAPFRAIDNAILRASYTRLRPSLCVPHAKELSKIVEQYVGQFEKSLLDDLPLDAKLSIAMDIWQSPYKQLFLAIAGYFIDEDWRL